MIRCRCGNEARYYTSSGDRTCSICTMLAQVPAVRESDLGDFIQAVADMVSEVRYGCALLALGESVGVEQIDKIKTMLGRYK